MSQTILITGGLGYIGSHTVVEFLNQGYEVIVIDNLCNSKAETKEKIEKITGKTFTRYNVDLQDKNALAPLFSAHPIDGIIHFAAYKAVGESCEKPFEYYHNNIIGGLNLYETALAHDIKKIVFSSSCTVYDSLVSKAPYDENCPRHTINPYGSTKFISEIILEDLAVHKAMQIVAPRYFNPIGAHKSGLIGEDPQGIPNNLLPYMYRVATGQYPQLSVRGNDYPTPDGTCIRDYLHVCDLAIAHLRAYEFLDKQEEKNCFETINLGTGKGSSVLEMITMFEEILQKPLPHTIGPRRAGDAIEIYANAKKAQNLLGWTAKYSVQEAIADGWNFIINN